MLEISLNGLYNPYVNVKCMVLILDCKSEIGAHIRSNPCYLICLRQLIRSRAGENPILFRKDQFSLMCAQNVLSYHPI